MRHWHRWLFLALLLPLVAVANAQKKSVRPGINRVFEDPDIKVWIGRFEGESREIAARCSQILAACKIRPGMSVADIGAGTGLFSRLFASAVGPQGRVYAVDIAARFVQHIQQTCEKEGIKNVRGVVCTPTSVELEPGSIDVAFICDTYHHFEFPTRTMRSIHRALRPSGQVIIIDFHRIEGVSEEWVLRHVRAGQATVTKEIESVGFRFVGESKLLKDNYFLRFEKVTKNSVAPAVR